MATAALAEKVAASAEPVKGVPKGVDPLFYAQLKYQRRQFDACVDVCTELLNRNPYDRVSARPLLRARGGLATGRARRRSGC